MKEVSGKELARILEKDGWKLARIRGRNHIYIKEGMKTGSWLRNLET